VSQPMKLRLVPGPTIAIHHVYCKHYRRHRRFTFPVMEPMELVVFAG
jgi:hypothetical protein